MTDRYRILAIGPLPPPTTGFAVITERMINALSVDHTVTSVNVSPCGTERGLRYHWSRVRRVLSAAIKLISVRRQSQIAYIGCEGDGGLVYTIALTTLARRLGYSIFLHHHSFGYIDRPRGLMRSLLRAGGRSLTHIFLCETMAEDFKRSYPNPLRYRVISNAAFVPAQTEAIRASDSGPLTIGLLSNLNRAKGLHTFLTLLEAAKARGLPIRGILAGPVIDPLDSPTLEKARASLGDTLTYLGPIQAAAKTAFFAETDVFVFPTTYVNEAQPTVIYEALAAGCLVVSHDRGCIRSQVGDDGLVVARDADFIAPTLEYLSALAADRELLATKRRSAQQTFRQLHSSMQSNVTTLGEATESAQQ